MSRLVDLVKLARLDYLIRHQATGNPDELAERLDISRSTLFELIAYLKEEMNAPIVYNRDRLSYIYSYLPKFYLGFEPVDTFDSDSINKKEKGSKDLD